jgi:hypothetical protein
MKLVALILTTGLLCSCSTQVMKRAHVVPIFDDQVLLSARPTFIGSGKALYDDPSFTRPKIWSYKQLADGSTVVHWISTPDARERLVFLDDGFHPIVVPPDAIAILNVPDHEVQNHHPTPIHILGTNSAFIRENVTLVPYKSKTKVVPTKRMQVGVSDP